MPAKEPVGVRAARIVRSGPVIGAAITALAALLVAVFFHERGASVVQTMKDSPGGIQAGRDVNIGNDRRIAPDTGAKIVTLLKAVGPLKVAAGTISPGEGTRLGEDFLALARSAGCDVNDGVKLGVGFPAFDGVRLLGPRDAEETPAVLVAIQRVLTDAGIASAIGRGTSVEPGSIYFYVGFKPQS